MTRLGFLAALVAAAALLGARPSEAHPVPFSYLDLRLQPGSLEGTLVVHVIDVAQGLGLATPERLLDPSTARRLSGAGVVKLTL